MNWVWVWLTVLLVAVVIEAATPSALISIWFAAGALFVMVL